MHERVMCWTDVEESYDADAKLRQRQRDNDFVVHDASSKWSVRSVV